MKAALIMEYKSHIFYCQFLFSLLVLISNGSLFLLMLSFCKPIKNLIQLDKGKTFIVGWISTLEESLVTSVSALVRK